MVNVKTYYKPAKLLTNIHTIPCKLYLQYLEGFSRIPRDSRNPGGETLPLNIFLFEIAKIKMAEFDSPKQHKNDFDAKSWRGQKSCIELLGTFVYKKKCFIKC